MKTAIKIIKANSMIKLSRKESFLFALIGNIIYFILVYYLWHGVYGSNSNVIRGLDFEDAVLYLFMAATIASLVTTNLEWFVSRDILSGNVQKYFLWPKKFYFIKMYEMLGTLICNLFSNTIPLFLFLCIQFKEIIYFRNFLWFVVSILASIFIMFSIDFFIGLSSFYTESIWGISTIKVALISFLSGGVVPIELFPELLKNILEVTPFVCIYQVPIRILLNQITVKQIIPILSLQIGWCAILSIAVVLFQKKAFKRMVINGG